MSWILYTFSLKCMSKIGASRFYWGGNEQNDKVWVEIVFIVLQFHKLLYFTLWEYLREQITCHYLEGENMLFQDLAHFDEEFMFFCEHFNP